MREAEALLRNFASEIEADLRYRGIDVADWHRGEMTDRQLITLVWNLPEDSAFKSALRDGDWPLDAYLLAGILNEIRALRADMRMMIAGQRMDFEPVSSPREQKRLADTQQFSRNVHDELMAQLRGENI